MSAKQQDELVDRYLAGEERSDKGFEARQAILAQLERAPELTDALEKSWRKKLAKTWERGRELEKKTGQAYWWEDEERGLYIVGGETKKPKGLLIAMHGGGAGAGDAWSSHGAYNGAANGLDWVAIYPEVLEKTEHGWTDAGTEEFVLDLVDAALRTWKLDRDRVYFAGHSMGGYGTWTLGAHHADRVAGLAPSAGAPTPIVDASGAVIGIDEGVIPSLRNVRLVIYQSDDDPQVPPAVNRGAAAELAKAREHWGGFDYEYWEVSGQGHGPPPGGYAAQLAKIAEGSRNAHPEKIVWQPVLAWKRQFHWLWWEKPALKQTVVAEVDRSKNSVKVECPGDAKGLHVLLDPALLDLEKEVVVFLGEKEVFRGLAQLRLSTLVRTGVHGDPELTFSSRVPLAP